jgi:hypothetical protein
MLLLLNFFIYLRKLDSLSNEVNFTVQEELEYSKLEKFKKKKNKEIVVKNKLIREEIKNVTDIAIEEIKKVEFESYVKRREKQIIETKVFY